jgi:hypothetical protein
MTAAAAHAGVVPAGMSSLVGVHALRHRVRAMLHCFLISLGSGSDGYELHVMRADEGGEIGCQVEAAHLETKDRQDHYGCRTD